MGKHSEWRKIAKKARRKRIRQSIAKHRDQCEEEEQRRYEKSPTYQAWLAQKTEAERLQLEENARLAAEKELEWQRIELEAQKQFKLLQEKLAVAREERAKQNEKIKLEWEKEQQRQRELKEKQQKELEEQLRQQELLNDMVDNFLANGGDTPEHLKTTSETNPNKQPCPFFTKTSTCRFFDVCSRNHIRPGISRIILIPNFFMHYSLEKTENEHTSDSSLEFENLETYNYYREFFYDVTSELETFGKIKVFKTCCNHEAHLRGNVFVEYASTGAALKSYKSLNGRWYGGKRLSVEFCNIPSWKNAVCGLHFVKRCPKGNACNFLHVFRNPRNLYNDYEDKHKRNSRHKHSDESPNLRNWRWSESPERFPITAEQEDRHERKHKNNSRRIRKERRSKSRSPKHKRLKSRSPSSRRKRSESRLRSKSPSRRKRRRSRSSSRRSTRSDKS